MSTQKKLGSSPMIRALTSTAGDFIDGVNPNAEGNKIAQKALLKLADVRGLLTSAPLVDTRLAAGPSAEHSSAVNLSDSRKSDTVDTTGGIYPSWRMASDDLRLNKTNFVACRGATGVYSPSSIPDELDDPWDDVPSLEDNSEYIHENVRRYRKPRRGAQRRHDIFSRMARDIGENYYYGTFLITNEGNQVWRWQLYQMTPEEILAIREKEERHMRKCGNRVSVKPLGIRPEVLKLALDLYPTSLIHMRHALGLPDAPKTLEELERMHTVIPSCLAAVSTKLPCYHYYKDKLTLVREGIEPNPGPAETAYARMQRHFCVIEKKLVEQLKTRYNFGKEDRRTLSDCLVGARRVRATASYDPEAATVNEDIMRGHEKLIDDMNMDSDALEAMVVSSGLRVVGQGFQYPDKPQIINHDVNARFWYILLDLVQNDFSLQGTSYVRLLGDSPLILLGTEVKSHLMNQPVSDPRISAQPGVEEANIAPIATNLEDTSKGFTDPHIEVTGATVKRERRRRLWSRSDAVPIGLLDLCRYLFVQETDGPFALYGIAKGLLETHARTGSWEIDENDILKNIDAQEARANKLKNTGLPETFIVDETIFPLYFTSPDEDDLKTLKELGLYEGDVVVSRLDHACVKKKNVYEFRAENGDAEVIVYVRNLVSEDTLVFEYPHAWCKLATKRMIGCTSTLREAISCCESFICRADHSLASSEMANYYALRVKTFAALLYGLANMEPGQSLSEAQVLQQIALDRPVAGGTYHEAYHTDWNAIEDKYRHLAMPCYRVGDHTVDNSFIIIRDPANVKLRLASRLAREGPEAPLPAYARPDPTSLWEQLQGCVKRLCVGRLPLDPFWANILENEVWPVVSDYVKSRADTFDIMTPDEIYRSCEEHATLKKFRGEQRLQYLGGAALFLRGANGEANLLDEGWRTEYGCFSKSENYAISGKKPARSIQCPDLFVRGYQHALLMNAQHNLFKKLFPHLTVKYMNDTVKMEHIKDTFRSVEKLACTDLTAMEKNVNKFMMPFEREIFKACSPTWMHSAIDAAWKELINCHRAISHQMFDLFVDPMRASGEDHTSAGNFVCNLMWICAWTRDARGILTGARPCLVEGDDGQVSVDGLELPTAEQIAGLGIRIKLETRLMDTTFVSKVVDNDRPVCDALSIAQNFSIIRDPDLATNHNDAAKQFAMALSYYYSYGGFPILGPYFRGYLLRHHDEVMGSNRGIQSVKNAFCAKYVGRFEPAVIEEMWQDVLINEGKEQPIFRTTAEDLAEVAGVPLRELMRIFSCEPNETVASIPSGGSFTVNDDVKAEVHAAHQAAKKTPPVRIGSAPPIVLQLDESDHDWWYNLWHVPDEDEDGTELEERYLNREVMTITGKRAQKMNELGFYPVKKAQKRRFAWENFLTIAGFLSLVMLGIGTTFGLVVCNAAGPRKFYYQETNHLYGHTETQISDAIPDMGRAMPTGIDNYFIYDHQGEKFNRDEDTFLWEASGCSQIMQDFEMKSQTFQDLVHRYSDFEYAIYQEHISEIDSVFAGIDQEIAVDTVTDRVLTDLFYDHPIERCVGARKAAWLRVDMAESVRRIVRQTFKDAAR